MRQFALGIAFAAVFTAVPAGSDETGAGRLDAARARWQAAASGDYRYGYRKHCECYRGEPPETVVTVAAGRVERVHHLHDGSSREVPAREGSLDYYWTIDELFDKLALAIERDATVRAEYDPGLGYPRTLFIDYDPTVTGDETDLRLTRFERL